MSLRPQDIHCVVFLNSCFSVSVAPSSNRPDFSIDYTILIISSISLFEINKVNPFTYFTVSLPLILLSNLSITFEAAFKAILLTNPGKMSLGKETAKLC